MSISLQSRRVGDITIIQCRGRIVLGAPADTLKESVESLLPDDPHVILEVSGVEYIDSAGLGMLVRLLNKTQFAKGDLKLCGISSRFAEVLRVSRLASIFESYASEAEAIAAFYQRPKPAGALERFRTDVLCVHESPDVVAYVGEVLKQAGLGVLTSTNLSDALMLMEATPPKLIVIGAGLRAQRGTWSADTFQKRAASLKVIELPADFSHQDAGDAGRRLLDDVRAVMTG